MMKKQNEINELEMGKEYNKLNGIITTQAPP